jgi:hypothetical protein
VAKSVAMFSFPTISLNLPKMASLTGIELFPQVSQMGSFDKYVEVKTGAVPVDRA